MLSLVAFVLEPSEIVEYINGNANLYYLPPDVCASAARGSYSEALWINSLSRSKPVNTCEQLKTRSEHHLCTQLGRIVVRSCVWGVVLLTNTEKWNVLQSEDLDLPWHSKCLHHYSSSLPPNPELFHSKSPPPPHMQIWGLSHTSRVPPRLSTAFFVSYAIYTCHPAVGTPPRSPWSGIGLNLAGIDWSGTCSPVCQPWIICNDIQSISGGLAACIHCGEWTAQSKEALE